jgi:hypothetical protein
MAWGEAPTDEPQRQRCRLRRPTFEVHKAACSDGAASSSGVLVSALRSRGRCGGAGDGRRFRCRDLQGLHCNFLCFEVLFAFVWVYMLLVPSVVRVRVLYPSRVK